MEANRRTNFRGHGIQLQSVDFTYNIVMNGRITENRINIEAIFGIEYRMERREIGEEKKLSVRSDDTKRRARRTFEAENLSRNDVLVLTYLVLYHHDLLVSRCILDLLYIHQSNIIVDRVSVVDAVR